jgi:hypothetical protein
MAEEIKTILKIEGDASGAVKAAEDAVRAAERAQSANSLGTSGGASGRHGPNAAIDLGGGQAREAAAGLGDVEQKANAARTAVQLLNNPVGTLLKTATEGTDALTELLTVPANLAVAGLTVAAVVIQGIIAEVKASMAAMQGKIDDWKKTLAEERKKRSQTTEDTATLMGRAGLTSKQSIISANQVRQQMVASGASADAVNKVLPMAIGPQGERLMSDEQIMQAAALAEYAPDKIPEVKKPGDVARSRERLLGQLQRQAPSIGDWRKVQQGRVERLDEDRRKLDDDAILKTIEQQGGSLSSDEKERNQQLEDIKRVAEKGSVSEEGLKWSYRADRQQYEMRQKRAVDSARLAGLISADQAKKWRDKGMISGRDVTRASLAVQTFGLSEVFGGSDSTERGQIESIGPMAGSDAAAAAAGNAPKKSAASQPTIVQNFNAPVYQGPSGGEFFRSTRVPS